MVKVHFQSISHELGGLPVMMGCSSLELLSRNSSDHINTGSPKIYK